MKNSKDEKLLKNILIKAYTEVNLGDDLFIKILCDRYPKTNFFINCDVNKTEPFKRIKNLEIVPKIKYIDSVLNILRLPFNINDFRVNRAINNINAVVHIGGSIFIQSKYWKGKLKSYNRLVENNKRFFLLGSNFGPYYDNEYLTNYSQVFSRMTDVCFRDTKSYNLFQTLENVRQAPDIVFNFDSSLIKPLKIKENTIVISLLDLSWRKELEEHTTKYEKMIVEISNKFINNNYKVILMSFCESEGDERVANTIKEKINSDLVSKYFYRGNLDEALELIKSSSGIIATRFHAMILGWLFDKPTIPIMYSNKMNSVLKDINYKGYSIDIKNEERWDVEKIYQQIDSNEIVNIKNLVKNAGDQFKALDSFILK